MSGYAEPLLDNAVVQLLVLLISGGISDDGFMLRVALMASVSFWLSIATRGLVRRRQRTRGDLIWASWGFAISYAMVLLIGPGLLWILGRW